MARSLPWLVVFAWLAGASFAFWFFELRLHRPFESADFALADSDGRVQRLESWFKSTTEATGGVAPLAPATLVHFYQAGCACNGFTDPHLAKIQEHYRTRGVLVVRLERTAALATGSPDWITTTPAALIFNAAGKLVYFGPYDDAAWCGTTGGPVERVLDQTLLGNSPHPQKVSVRGCFCGGNTTKIKGNIL